MDVETNFFVDDYYNEETQELVIEDLDQNKKYNIKVANKCQQCRKNFKTKMALSRHRCIKNITNRSSINNADSASSSASSSKSVTESQCSANDVCNSASYSKENINTKSQDRIRILREKLKSVQVTDHPNDTPSENFTDTSDLSFKAGSKGGRRKKRKTITKRTRDAIEKNKMLLMRRPQCPQEFACDKCGHKFLLKRALLLHQQTHAKKEQKLITKRARKKQHTLNSEELDTNNIGGKYFKRRKTSEEGDFQCETCDKRYYTVVDLNLHRLTHKQPYNQNKIKANKKCTVCGKHFKSQIALNQHQKLHDKGSDEDERLNYKTFTNRKVTSSFDCGECDQTFKTRNGLRVHMRSHDPSSSDSDCDSSPDSVNDHHRMTRRSCLKNASLIARTVPLETSNAENDSSLHLRKNKSDSKNSEQPSSSKNERTYMTNHTRMHEDLNTMSSETELGSGSSTSDYSPRSTELSYSRTADNHENLSNVNNTSKYKCAKCNSSFKSSLVLSIHAKIHTCKVVLKSRMH